MSRHEYLPPDDKNRLWCKYCGCLFHPQMDATCLARPDPEPRPRGRKISALDDVEQLRKRLEEIEKEKAAADPKV
jgi:hypothetical protein